MNTSMLGSPISQLHTDRMAKALLEIGDIIVQECDYYIQQENNLSYHDTKSLSVVRHSIESISDENTVPKANLLEAIVDSVKSLVGRRRIELEDMKGKLKATSEQIAVQKKFIDDTGHERQKLLQINAQLTSQVSEISREVLLSPRTSSPGLDSRNVSQYDSGRSSILDQVKRTLKEQVFTLNEENDKLHKLANDFRKTREHMEEEVEEMRSKERGLRWEVEQKARDVNSLESLLEKSRKELIKSKELISSLTLQKETLEKALNDLKEKYENLEQSKCEIEGELNMSKTTEITLKSSLETEQLNNERLVAEKENLIKEINKLRDIQLRLSNEKMQMDTKRHDLEMELEITLKSMEETNNEVIRLDTQLTETSLREELLKNENNSLKISMDKQLKNLNADLNILNNKLADLKEENDKVKTDHKKIKELFKNEKEKNEELYAVNEDFKRKMNTLERENEKVEDDLSHLLLVKNDMEKKKDSLERQLQYANKENEKYKQSLVKISTENEELHQVRLNLGNELKKLNQEYEIKLQQERHLRKQEIDSQQHDFQLEKTTIEARNDEMINQIKLDRERQLSELREELAKSKRENDLLERDHTEKVNEIQRDKLALEIMLQQEKTRMMNELQKVKQKLATVESDMQHKQDDWNQTKSHLKNDNEKLIREREEIVVKFREEMDVLNDNIEELNSQIELINNSKLETIRELERMKTKQKQKDNEHSALNQSLATANEKIKAWAVKHKQQQQELENIKEAMDYFEREKDQKENELKEIKEKFNLKIEESMKMSSELEMSSMKQKNEEKMKKELLNDLNELRATLREVEKSRHELRKEIMSQKSVNSSLENELKIKINEISELKALLNNQDTKTSQIQTDILKQTDQLKKQIDGLKNERGTLENSLETSRQSTNQLKDMNKNLSLRVMQLEAEMNLSEIKRKEAESNLETASESIIKKEQKIIDLKNDVPKFQEINKDKPKSSKTNFYASSQLEKSPRTNGSDSFVSVSPLPQNSTTSSYPKFRESQNSKQSNLMEETSIISHGLAALEEDNVRLQDEVRSLQSMMSETLNDQTKYSRGSPNLSKSRNASKLRLAQMEAEELLKIREKTHKKHVNQLEREISSLRGHMFTSPPKFRSTPSQTPTRVDEASTKSSNPHAHSLNKDSPNSTYLGPSSVFSFVEKKTAKKRLEL